MTAVRIWSALVAIFGLGVAFAFTGTSRPPDLLLGSMLVVAALALGVTGSRTASLLVAAVTMLVYWGPVSATMTAHVIWFSVALALFSGDTLRLVLRVQVGVVYLFAATNKLWPPFLSGDILENNVSLMPGWAPLAVAVVVFEAGLGVLVLCRWRWAPYAVVALHLPMALLAGQHPLHAVTLLTYGGMMLWGVVVGLSAPVQSHDRSCSEVRPAHRVEGDDVDGVGCVLPDAAERELSHSGP